MTAFELEGEFTGYYNFDDETQISDGPMQMSLNCERIVTEGQTISRWVLKGRGSDGAGQFTIYLHIDRNGNVEGIKRYEIGNLGWIGAITSRGLKTSLKTWSQQVGYGGFGRKLGS